MHEKNIEALQEGAGGAQVALVDATLAPGTSRTLAAESSAADPDVIVARVARLAGRLSGAELATIVAAPHR